MTTQLTRMYRRSDGKSSIVRPCAAGLAGLTKSIVTPMAEQMLILEQISTSVLVGPKQLPGIHKLVLEAAGPSVSMLTNELSSVCL
jgi:hypothetical protein